jgi:hypothetical protein
MRAKVRFEIRFPEIEAKFKFVPRDLFCQLRRLRSFVLREERAKSEQIFDRK